MKHRTPFLLVGLAIVGIVGLLTYSTLVEPYRIEVVRHDMRKAGEPATLRVIQVSDLHLRDFGKHERDLPDRSGHSTAMWSY